MLKTSTQAEGISRALRDDACLQPAGLWNKAWGPLKHTSCYYASTVIDGVVRVCLAAVSLVMSQACLLSNCPLKARNFPSDFNRGLWLRESSLGLTIL